MRRWENKIAVIEMQGISKWEKRIWDKTDGPQKQEA